MLAFTSAGMDRVSEIVRLEAAADVKDVEASELRWLAAELIVAELESGKSQRQLAREIGKTQQHVSRVKISWDVVRHLKVSDRPPFNTVYNSSEVRTPKASKAARSDSEPSKPAVQPSTQGMRELPSGSHTDGFNDDAIVDGER